ncbi:MAG: UvrD-helicase domain-containing protein [Parachlamydiales bacterium]|jgi:DNA helicase-2/ATP-dependent DNA helicase PcrA
MLNKNQLEAVNLVNGRILVLAGAGSGKTKVITHRIAHLIKNAKVDPKSILGLTFTNKAANEMKERLNSLIGSKAAKDVVLSTFHSFCLMILRKEAEHLGYSKNFSIYDNKDMQRLLSQVLKDDHHDEKKTPASSTILEKISEIKNKNLNLEEYAFDDIESKNLYQEIYPKLAASLKTYNAMDLDSILTLTDDLFNKSPQILKKYQEIYKYILIDEYQDTNNIQYQIAEKLSQKSNNLFVVGDDDQSIYGFRGSCIKHILEFKADHTVKLEQNYRSTSIILHAANALIKNNKSRYEKSLFSQNLSDEKIVLFHTPNEEEEAKAVIERAIALKTKNNLKWSDIAILYRSNSLSRNVEMALLNAVWKKDDSYVRSIPYDIYGGLDFASRSEIKDLLAYLRLISNSKDQEALLRIINVPRRGISDKTIEALNNYSKKDQTTIWNILQKIYQNDENLINELNLQPKVLHSINSFMEVIEKAKFKFSNEKLSQAFEWLIHSINYKKAIEEDVKSEKARQIKWENAMDCLNAITAYEESESEPSLRDFIANSLLFKDNINKKRSSNDDRIQLMTFHSSKGLEFEACFLIGLEDHIIPHEKMLTSIEEERRLLYVGITRAKKYLTLSMSRSRRRTASPKASNPSRFLFEIPKELLKIISWKDLC